MPDVIRINTIITVRIEDATMPIVEKTFFSFLPEKIAKANAIISSINAIMIPNFEYSTHPIIKLKLFLIFCICSFSISPFLLNVKY